MACEHLTGRMREICEGTSGLPPEVEQKYRELWAGNAPAQANLDCVHRGEQDDWIDCPTCVPEKHVKLKVFLCRVHGRCVLPALKDYPDIAQCASCKDRLEPAAA